jgi:hypothetical protein
VADTAAQELSGNESTGNEEIDEEKSDEEEVSLDASVEIIEQDDEEDGKLPDLEKKEEQGFSPDIPSINLDVEMAKYRYFQNAPALSPPGGMPPFISHEASIAGGFNTLSGNSFGGNGMHAFISPSPLQMRPFSLANNGNFGAQSTGLDLDFHKKETSRGRRTEAKKGKRQSRQSTFVVLVLLVLIWFWGTKKVATVLSSVFLRVLLLTMSICLLHNTSPTKNDN